MLLCTDELLEETCELDDELDEKLMLELELLVFVLELDDELELDPCAQVLGPSMLSLFVSLSYLPVTLHSSWVRVILLYIENVAVPFAVGYLLRPMVTLSWPSVIPFG